MNPDRLLQQISDFFAIQRQRPRSVRVFEALCRLVDRGRDHLQAWGELHRLVQTDPALVELTGSFFLLTGIAHLEAATLHAAKLTEKQNDSANVTYLLNTIQAERNKLIGPGAWPTIKAIIESARLRLQEIESVVQRVKQKRDRELAHLDRRDIDMSPDWQAIAVEDLEKAFDTVDRIANELGGSIPAFAEVGRFPVDQLLGAGGFEDLVYFTRVAFNDDRVTSPNERVEKIREFDRYLQEDRAGR